MSRTIFINYADENFSKIRWWNSLSGRLIGKCALIREISPTNIDKDFFDKNRKIFEMTRGAGLWLWKPYIISKTLKECELGDFLLYTDSSVVFLKNIKTLTAILEEDGGDIMLFENSTIEKCFTKREIFYFMDCEEAKANLNQLQASFLLFRKSPKSEAFVDEWLKYAQDERLLSSKHFCKNIEEFPEYVVHREDQSILSVLAKKWEIHPFRDPSQYGDRPWEYAGKKHLVRFRKYGVRDVPTTFLLCRKTHPLKMLFKESLKRLLYGIGVMSKEKYLKKYGIPRENILGDDL